MIDKNDIDRAVQKLFLALITGIGAFGLGFLKDLNQEISSLNHKMAVVVEKLSLNERMVNDHEIRIRNLEIRGDYNGRFEKRGDGRKP